MMIVKKVVSKHFHMEIDRLCAVNWSLMPLTGPKVFLVI